MKKFGGRAPGLSRCSTRRGRDGKVGRQGDGCRRTGKRTPWRLLILNGRVVAIGRVKGDGVNDILDERGSETGNRDGGPQAGTRKKRKWTVGYIEKIPLRVKSECRRCKKGGANR